MSVPTEYLGSLTETAHTELTITPAFPLPMSAPEALPPTEPGRVTLNHGFFREFNGMALITGKTGDEVLEQLTTTQFRLVYQALRNIPRTPPDPALDKSDFAQDALSRFRRTHNLERHYRTGEFIIFPHPMMPQLARITQRVAIDAYRSMSRRPQIDRDSDVHDSDYKNASGPSDLLDASQAVNVRTVLEAYLGTAVCLSPLEEDILKNIYFNEKSPRGELAERHNTTANSVGVAKHRLLTRLRKQAGQVTGIAKKPQHSTD